MSACLLPALAHLVSAYDKLQISFLFRLLSISPPSLLSLAFSHLSLFVYLVKNNQVWRSFSVAFLVLFAGSSCPFFLLLIIFGVVRAFAGWAFLF